MCMCVRQRETKRQKDRDREVYGLLWRPGKGIPRSNDGCELWLWMLGTELRSSGRKKIYLLCIIRRVKEWGT